MSMLSDIVNGLTGRVNHVPQADLPEVIDHYNEQAAANGAASITTNDWRRFEETQSLYLTKRLTRQATPRQLQGVASVVEAITQSGPHLEQQAAPVSQPPSQAAPGK
jgi:hypothetical protein